MLLTNFGETPEGFPPEVENSLFHMCGKKLTGWKEMMKQRLYENCQNLFRRLHQIDLGVGRKKDPKIVNDSADVAEYQQMLSDELRREEPAKRCATRS